MSDPTLKDKIQRFKAILADFDKLEKNVQAQLMEVADKMAPMVQGGGIAPKTLAIPEPIEYPDIKVAPVHGIKKHALELFADQFAKMDWKPMEKTQKNPSEEVPFIQKPEKGGPINPHNVQKAKEDKKVKKDQPTFGGQPTGTTTLGSIIGFPSH